MRRNNNIPRGSQNAGVSGGPLLTNHLRDLDLELELLKRKREMVEQQQHLLNLNFTNPSYLQRQNNHGGFDGNFVQTNQDFNQPRVNQPPSLLSNFNYSNLYDEAPQPFRQHGKFDRQHGTKRPATVGIWENDSVPKRFSGPQRPSHKPPPRRNDTPRRPPLPRNNYQKTGPPPAPARSKPDGQRYGNSGQFKPYNRNYDSLDAKPKQRNVTNNKIHKTTTSAPNKLKSYPVEQRKALVKEALQSGKPKDHVLLADVEPDKQTSGRLELALGHILKDMKQQFGEVTEFQDHFIKIGLNRALKNVIRERLRSAMIGKFVRVYPEVIKIYRAKFPKETDREILDLASEKVKEENSSRQFLKIVDEVHPEKYFRQNIQRLIKSTLEEMFIKLQEIYVTDGEWKKNPNKTEDSVVETEDVNKEGEKKSTDKSVADNTIEDVGNTSGIDGDKGINDSQENNVTLDKTGEIDEKKKDENDDKETEETKADKEDDTFSDPENSKTIAFYDNIMNMLLKRRLPHLLPRFKETIIKFLDIKSEFRKTKAAIILGANQRAEKLIESRKQEANQSNTEANSKTKYQRNFPQDAPYFVKIFARPSLPKRPVMQTFLDKFNPKSIKRHKNVHNLLFVGFSDEEDFKSILKEDNCIIGKSSLSIKASDKNKEESTKANVSADGETVKMVEAIEKAALQDIADISIPSDIDNQITDLLSSINDSNDEKEKDNTDLTAEEAANGEKENVDEKIDDNAEEALLNEENSNMNAEICEVGNEGKVNQDANKDDEGNKDADIEKEKEDTVGELKNEALDALKDTGKSTPTRASNRLASSTPNTIKTRRASRLAQD